MFGVVDPWYADVMGTLPLPPERAGVPLIFKEVRVQPGTPGQPVRVLAAKVGEGWLVGIEWGSGVFQTVHVPEKSWHPEFL